MHLLSPSIAGCVLGAAMSLPPLRGQEGALVTRHGALVKGTVEASIVALADSADVTVERGAAVTGDLILPAEKSPPTAGASDADKAKTKLSPHAKVAVADAVSVKGKQKLSDGFDLPKMEKPRTPTGTSSALLQTEKGNDPDFKKTKDITVNNARREIAMPPGVYGGLSVDSGRVLLGQKGAIRPMRYHFQRLSVGRNAQIDLLGPAIVTVGTLGRIQGALGSAQFPNWLDLRVAGGAITLDGSSEVHGVITAGESAATLGNGAKLRGGLACDRATLEANSKFTGIKPDWSKESSGNSAPLFIHKALRVQSRLPELSSRFKHSHTPSLAYADDIPTLMLVSEIVGEPRFAVHEERKAFFRACCTLFDGTGFGRGVITLVRPRKTPQVAPEVVNVALEKAQFEENLRAVGQEKLPRENIARIRDDPLLLNLFMERSLKLARGFHRDR